MKKLLTKHFFAITVLICSTLCSNRLHAQVTFAALTSGVTGTITSGTSQVCVMGFSATATSSSITLNSFTFNDSRSSIDQFLANGTLYRSTTSTFNASSPGTVVAGNVTFSGSNITISGFQETITTTTNYYFLVADAINTAADGDEQIVVSYGSTFATDINGNSYQAKFSGNYHHPYVVATPYALSVSVQSTSLNSPGTGITIGATGLKLFEFSITNKSSSTYTLSQFNINSNTSSLGSILTNFKLYNNTNSNTFPSTGAISTVASTSSSYVTFSLTNETIAAGVTKYYWLVADAGGGSAGSVQFNFSDGQSGLTSPTNPSIVATAPVSKNFNTPTVYGSTYSINYANLTVTSLTGGTSSGTLSVLQSSVVLFGFSVASSSTISVSAFNINSTNTAQSYFGNGVLYRCNGTNYSTATSKVAVGTVTFNGTYANVAFTTPESITSSTTNQNYFLVADNISGASSSTIAFNFTSGQSTSAIVQTSPASTYNTFSISGNTLTLPSPTVILSDANSVSANGISTANIGYGQSDIVLFGFGAKAFGSTMSVTKFTLMTSGGADNGFFSNGKLYRSTSPVFPGGTPLYTGISFGGGGNVAITVNESIPSGTTYYYFLTADYTVGWGTTSGMYFYFSSGQSPVAVTSSPTSVNTYAITGRTFYTATSLNWKGTVDNDMSKASNYQTTNGGSGFVPTSSTVINIGGAGITFTNAPTLKTSMAVGGINLGATGTPTLTVNAGQTLTINTEMNIAGTSGKITAGGSGAVVALASTASSNVAPSASLTIDGGLSLTNAGTFTTGSSSTITLSNVSSLTNSGTFTLASTATLNLTGNSTVSNTNSFTLASDANGSATIGQLSGTSALTGSYNVQRYIQGQGSISYRGYRLLSSPVSDATQTAYYSLAYLKGSGSYLTGTNGAENGFDVSGNATIYLYRQDKAPSTSPTAGNFISVTNIKNSNLYQVNTSDNPTTPLSLPVGNGFFYFFRGNNSTVTTALPSDVTLSASGHLNQGQITVKPWFYSLTPSSFASSDNLSYTPSITGATGYTLVGNPYASSIDWRTAYNNATSTSGIYAPNVDATIYVYNAYQKKYATYQSTGTSTAGIAVNGGSYIIPSGQGFFVHTTSANAKVVFNESAKISSQLTGSNLLLNSASVTDPNKILRVKLVKDAIEQEETVIAFNSNAKNTYIDGEDATYLKGYGVVSFASQSADRKLLAINKLPLPKTSQSIPLAVMVTQTGTYHIDFAEQSNVPDVYDMWLKDAYLKDSLDIKHNSSYSFKVSADTGSTGANRFSIVMRLNPDKMVHLLNFAASKETNQVKINWTAENEANCTNYVLQRSTDAGKTFKVLDSLTSASLGRYDDIDPSPILGDNYYRLKQTDVSGNISYSNVVKVMYANVANTILANSNISVYPNPAKSTLNLAITNINNTNTIATASYKITITNSLGLPVKTDRSSGTNWQGQIDNLLPGTYFIQVINTKDNTLAGKSTFVKL